MGIAHLVHRKAALADLTDEHPPRQPMIDDAARAFCAAQRTDRESHRRQGTWRREIPAASDTTGNTGTVAANIIYGSGIPDDRELRLCGDVTDGWRAVELGVSPWRNAVTFAANGAKAIAVDPDGERLAGVRRAAEAAEVTVQCLATDLADLGDITSGTCDVVVAAQTLLDVDDLSRVFRQVHRILKASMPFVISVPHPFAGVSFDEPYGAGPRTVGEWFITLGRSNFRVDHLLELGVTGTHPAPTTLVLRARKEGS